MLNRSETSIFNMWNVLEKHDRSNSAVLYVLASPRVEHMNQNMPIMPGYEETFAKYIDIQNM